MSEYQYYEFRAIDRPLTEEEMDELGDLSSRAEITPTSFTNTYNYGDFRGDPEALIDRYFDAFVYVSNWGINRLIFRIPRRFIDVKAAEAYSAEDALELTLKKQHVVIEFARDDEGGRDGWVEGEPWMPALIGLRADLIRGDFRALYLGWLASIPFRGEEDDEVEPPVPPGLAKLSAPLRELTEFLGVENELIEAAAASSEALPADPSRDELSRWVGKLPAADKDAYLLRLLVDEEGSLLRSEILRRHRAETAPRKGKTAPSETRRTVSQLLAARNALVEEKALKKSERDRRERERLEREKAEKRVKHLNELAGLEPAAWREVDKLIATKLPKNYDTAVDLLVDLLEIADRAGRRPEAESRVRELRQRHARKSTLMERLDKRKLGQ